MKSSEADSIPYPWYPCPSVVETDTLTRTPSEPNHPAPLILGCLQSTKPAQVGFDEPPLRLPSHNTFARVKQLQTRLLHQLRHGG